MRLRLEGYDYSQTGAYFLTVCAKDRHHVFGEIIDGDMQLNANGQIVADCWNDLARRYVTIQLDTFVVMPNHVHGIVMIFKDVDPVGAIHEPARPQ